MSNISLTPPKPLKEGAVFKRGVCYWCSAARKATFLLLWQQKHLWVELKSIPVSSSNFDPVRLVKQRQGQAHPITIENWENLLARNGLAKQKLWDYIAR